MEVFIEGFSKKNKEEKLEAIARFLKSPEEKMETFKSFDHADSKIQETINEFSENTISNFHLPFSIAPNFLINGKTYAVPMVIEESSVVAAASKSAKFWYNLGGFKTKIVDTEKVGQVHFLWHDDIEKLKNKLIKTQNRGYQLTEKYDGHLKRLNFYKNNTNLQVSLGLNIFKTHLETEIESL